jgi:hypothetical protein
LKNLKRKGQLHTKLCGLLGEIEYSWA